jgi:hypothetical protein
LYTAAPTADRSFRVGFQRMRSVESCGVKPTMHSIGHLA